MSGYVYDRDKAAKRLAELVSEGMTTPKVLSVMKSEFDPYMTNYQMGALKRIPVYLDFISSKQESLRKQGKDEFITGCALMVKDALKALHKKVKAGDIAGISLVVKTGLGMDSEEEVKQDNNITVIMSGGSSEKDVTTRDIPTEAIRGTKT